MTVIAIVDDDPELGSLMGDYLKTNGYESSLFVSGEAFLDSDRTAIGLVVLDVGLPGIDGFSVCQRVREESSVPIIMLTAASDDIDRILGLELGADDYMGKPFNPRELLARIKALLRRAGLNAQKAKQLTVKQADRRGLWQGQPIDLTGAEFELLQLFYDRSGSILSRDEISIALKGHGVSPFDRSIDTLVSRLRKKLKTASSSDLIRSVRGKGYVLSI
jgi:DNA-binding response OmpR family regulator